MFSYDGWIQSALEEYSYWWSERNINTEGYAWTLSFSQHIKKEKRGIKPALFLSPFQQRLLNSLRVGQYG